MYECDHCDDRVDLPYQCNYCGGQYCPEHRLPEGHDCDGVEFLAGDQRWFRDKDTGETVHSRSDFAAPEPIEPEYTVGTPPEPEYDSPPDVELKPDRDANRGNGRNIVSRVLRWLLGR